MSPSRIPLSACLKTSLSLTSPASFSSTRTRFTMAPPIAIIGAGPCGLTLARLLDRDNIAYIIYERDVASAPARHSKIGVGGSLDLHPGSGQRALEAAGLFQEFKRHARYDATQFILATQDAEVKFSIGEGRDAPEIDRSQLRQMLLDAVPAERIKWDHGVKRVEMSANDETWGIEFANGSRVDGFKLVVGTDGAWSKVRPVVCSAMHPCNSTQALTKLMCCLAYLVQAHLLWRTLH